MEASSAIPEHLRVYLSHDEISYQDFLNTAELRDYIALAASTAAFALTVISSYAILGVIGGSIFAVTAVALNIGVNIARLPGEHTMSSFRKAYEKANIDNTILQVALSSIAGAFYLQGLWSIPCIAVTVLSLGLFAANNAE